MWSNEPEERNVVQVTGLPLTSIGFITWIVFMILDYGCHVEWLSNHFWTWFPLWIPWAIEFVFFLIVILVYYIINKIE